MTLLQRLIFWYKFDRARNLPGRAEARWAIRKFTKERPNVKLNELYKCLLLYSYDYPITAIALSLSLTGERVRHNIYIACVRARKLKKS